MWKILVLCTIVGLATGQMATYRDYKVFRIVPRTQEQVDMLRHLDTLSDGVSRFVQIDE